MKKLLCLALCLLLPIGALAQVNKEEIVYARLTAGGEPLALYVVNAFETDEQATITDYGVYTQRVNLTTIDALSAGEAQELTLAPGRFYYQGNGLAAELPWTVDIGYLLDSEKMPVSDLGGATGALEIILSITKNEHSTYPADGFTLQITLTLDGTCCTGISAPGGTVAAVGGNRAITYMLLPGMEGAYTITANVDNFRMDSMQIAAVRMNIDGDMYLKAFTNGMEPAMQNIAKSLMAPVFERMAGGMPTSFVDERNIVSSVQFVLMTEPVERPAPASVQQAEGTAAQGFWDRLLDLFR